MLCKKEYRQNSAVKTSRKTSQGNVKCYWKRNKLLSTQPHSRMPHFLTFPKLSLYSLSTDIRIIEIWKRNQNVNLSHSFFSYVFSGFFLLDRLENVDISFNCHSTGFDSGLPRLRSSGKKLYLIIFFGTSYRHYVIIDILGGFVLRPPLTWPSFPEKERWILQTVLLSSYIYSRYI